MKRTGSDEKKKERIGRESSIPVLRSTLKETAAANVYILHVACLDCLASVLLGSFDSAGDQFLCASVELFIEVSSDVDAVCCFADARLLQYFCHWVITG